MAPFFVNSDGIQLKMVPRNRGMGKDNVIIISVRVTTNPNRLVRPDVEAGYTRSSKS